MFHFRFLFGLYSLIVGLDRLRFGHFRLLLRVCHFLLLALPRRMLREGDASGGPIPSLARPPPIPDRRFRFVIARLVVARRAIARRAIARRAIARLVARRAIAARLVVARRAIARRVTAQKSSHG